MVDNNVNPNLQGKIMADTRKTNQVQEKIRQTLENLGNMLNEWLNRGRPAFNPVPVPVDRPIRRK